MAPVIILLTITRGHWIAFLSAVFMFFLLGRRLTSFSGKARIIGFGLILVSMALVNLQLFVSEEFFQGRVSNPDNVLGRFATWQATLQLASGAPVFGVGLNNLNGLLANMQVNFGNFENYHTPHNSFLSIFAELGAIGLFGYLGIVVSIVQNGLRLYRKGRSVQEIWRGIAIVAIMIGYQVPSLFAATFYIGGLIHIYVYAFVGAIAGVYSRRQSSSTFYPFAVAANRRASNRLAQTAGRTLPSTSRASLR
jgi:O-antigen ligase